MRWPRIKASLPICGPNDAVVSDPTADEDHRGARAERAAGRTKRATRRLTRYLPSATDYRGLGQSWRGDVIAGVTVGVVALPLALAFGITSGLGATAGLMTAIVAGAVA